MKQVNLDTMDRAGGSLLLRALFYGASGSGKTRLIGTATENDATWPLLVLNARGQPISLRFFERRPLVLEVEELTDLNDPHEWISNGQPWEPVARALANRNAPPRPVNPFYAAVGDFFGGVQGRFSCIAIDSVTHIQTRVGDRVAGNKGTPPGEMPPAVAGFDMFRQMLRMTTNISDLFYQLPIHVIITALERHNEMPTLGITKYYPMLWGQSSLEVPSHAELVGRLLSLKELPGGLRQATEKREGKDVIRDAFNILLTSNARDYIAKWQGLEEQPDYLVEPTITKILDRMALG